MGGEVLIFIPALAGVALFAFLVFRSFHSSARLYALPTLVLSVFGGAYAASNSGHPFNPWLFFAGFGVAAVIFGVLAHAIRWFREPRT